MPVNSYAELLQLTAGGRQARQRALDVIALARRERIPISTAVRRLRERGRGATLPSVMKYAGEATTRDAQGRLVATRSDRLYRRVPVETTSGVQLVDVYSSEEASLAGRHRNAVRAYRRGRDPGARRLESFRGRTVGGAELETDRAVIRARPQDEEFDELQQEGS